MAFKFDMEKLMSPRSQADIDEEESRRQERLRVKIETRSARIKALAMQSGLSTWERQFIAGLEYKATTYDVGDVFAGDLASLSEKQVDTLDKLYAKFVPQVQESNQAPTETGGRHG